MPETHVNATNFRKNLFEYLNMAIDYNDVVNINTKKGNAVLVSEEEYRGMVETLELLKIPGMKEKLVDGLNEPLEDCLTEQEVEW